MQLSSDWNANTCYALFDRVGPIGSVEIAELDWGDDSHVKLLDPPFDYIIGTDVVCGLPPPFLPSCSAYPQPNT